MRQSIITGIFILGAGLSGCQPDNSTPLAVDIADTPDTAQITETAEERERRLRATFPAQQRPPGDPELIARGSAVYEINCRSCHGQDLRGGDLGGPNLLRSQVVLKDMRGELIGEVIRNGQSTQGATVVMPALDLGDVDVEAVAEYVHSVVATSQGQGAPPPIDIELDIVVGDADKGREFFERECSACHSVTGDLAGYASVVESPEFIQNSWVAGRRWRGTPAEGSRERRAVRVTVELSNDEVISGILGRRDDFLISLTTEEGDYRSFTLFENTEPSVVNIETNDPLKRHREMMSELSDETMHDVTAYMVTLK